MHRSLPHSASQHVQFIIRIRQSSIMLYSHASRSSSIAIVTSKHCLTHRFYPTTQFLQAHSLYNDKCYEIKTSSSSSNPFITSSFKFKCLKLDSSYTKLVFSAVSSSLISHGCQDTFMEQNEINISILH